MEPFISIYLLKIVRVVDGVQVKIFGDNGDVTLRCKRQKPRRIVPSWRRALWRWHREASQRHESSSNHQLK